MCKNTFFALIGRLAAFLLLATVCHAPCGAFSVVIDAGHGGKDYGAKGNKAYEKDINLAVAKLIGKYIEKNYPAIDVLMTRSTDTYLTLKERADFANKNSGDLFVSIHVNSVDKKNRNRANIEGASVYTLGLHKSDANFEVAKRENSVISLENDYSASYEGFDPESAESYIIFEMSQNKHMGQSVNLAQQIQNQLISSAGRVDRGVRQAGFWVLWATGMPSVLVELDFICNPRQEKFLASESGQKKMADAIGRAIGRYAETHAGVEAPGPVADADGFQPAGTEADDLDAVAPVPNDAKPSASKPGRGKDKNRVSFHVQILATAKAIGKNSSEFKGYSPSEFREGKWHKYYLGDFDDIADARGMLAEVKKKFPEAFIIKMRDGKRLTE